MIENNTDDSNTPRMQYRGDGTVSSFEYPFLIFDKHNIEVYFDDTLQTGNYTVEINDDNHGGRIIFDEPPAANVLITIFRQLEYKRVTDFQESAPIRKTTLNYELNYSTACIQQLGDLMTRTMLLPPYANKNFSLSLPTPVPNKGLGWNDDGSALVNTNISITDLDNELTVAIKKAEDAQAAAEQQAQLAAETVATIDGVVDEVTGIANNVNGILFSKTDVDGNNATFANLSQAALDKIIWCEKPDYCGYQVMNIITGTVFKSPGNGYIHVQGGKDGMMYMQITDPGGNNQLQYNKTINTNLECLVLPICEDDYIRVSHNTANAVFSFIPLKGVNNDISQNS